MWPWGNNIFSIATVPSLNVARDLEKIQLALDLHWKNPTSDIKIFYRDYEISTKKKKFVKSLPAFKI